MLVRSFGNEVSFIMSMQVVCDCQAFVYKLDLSQNRYVAIVSNVCDIQLVSINPRTGNVPGRKLLAFEKGSDLVSLFYVNMYIYSKMYLTKIIVLPTISALAMVFQVSPSMHECVYVYIVLYRLQVLLKCTNSGS